jgi:hypothetical protein
VWATEADLGGVLTDGQRHTILGVCTSGAGVDLVLGVAGAGKTTAIAGVRHAYQQAGYRVVGTSTSGQAARTLGTEAGIDVSRTLRSLLWRLDHGRLQLDPGTVVVHDEAGIATDTDVLRLLVAAELAGAKVVMVGDDRQLGAVGPGGALRALLERHRPAVHILKDNVRQEDPNERRALAHLRAGNVQRAVAWYADEGRIVTAPTRTESLDAMVDAWATDLGAGRETAIYAWRRANVEELNRRARARMAADGRLSGPELTAAPGGCRYAAGDRIVTLAPGADGQLVTSERGRVLEVDPRAGTLTARMDDGRLQPFAPEETTADRLALGYAVTIHRSQGATVDIAHRYEDGGGRELAYVAMSRARHSSHVYVVADNRDQAVEDLARDWSAEHRPRWAIDTGTPVPEFPPSRDHSRLSPESALRLARLRAEREAVAAAVPPDPRPLLQSVEYQLADLHQALVELGSGRGRYADTPEGDAAQALARAQHGRRQAETFARMPNMDWRSRRHWHRSAKASAAEETTAQERFQQASDPERERLEGKISALEEGRHELLRQVDERDDWLSAHPEAQRRLDNLDHEIDRATPRPDHGLLPPELQQLAQVRQPELGAGLDLGP